MIIEQGWACSSPVTDNGGTMADAPGDRPGGLRDRWRLLAARVRSLLAGARAPGWRAHTVHAVGVLLVVIAGAAAGAALAPSTTADVGPIEAQVSVVPSLSPGVRLLRHRPVKSRSTRTSRRSPSGPASPGSTSRAPEP